MSDPARLVDQMLERSRRKLLSPKNLAKGSWLLMTDEQIRTRIMDEIRELLAALENGTWEEIADEAGDVYHFASMGADPERSPRPVSDRYTSGGP
jgi:NTP pyrophosphatase (non-canonical NTP hydrolase)